MRQRAEQAEHPDHSAAQVDALLEPIVLGLHPGRGLDAAYRPAGRHPAQATQVATERGVAALMAVLRDQRLVQQPATHGTPGGSATRPR